MRQAASVPPQAERAGFNREKFGGLWVGEKFRPGEWFGGGLRRWFNCDSVFPFHAAKLRRHVGII